MTVQRKLASIFMQKYNKRWLKILWKFKKNWWKTDCGLWKWLSGNARKLKLKCHTLLGFIKKFTTLLNPILNTDFSTEQTWHKTKSLCDLFSSIIQIKNQFEKNLKFSESCRYIFNSIIDTLFFPFSLSRVVNFFMKPNNVWHFNFNFLAFPESHFHKPLWTAMPPFI
jgi:hypothetical protein